MSKQIDAAFAATIAAAMAELCDLLPDAPVTVEPYRDMRMADVRATTWDGRPITYTFRQEGTELFLVHGLGCRYRVVAGDYYSGRPRGFAAFLVTP